MNGLTEEYGNESVLAKSYANFLTRFAKGFEQKKIESLKGESPEDLETRYKEGLKKLYGYDDKEAEVMKLMEYAQSAGGTIELALDMVLMAVGGEVIMAANAGKYAESTNKILQLLTKVYGPQRGAQAMRFLTTLNNIGIDTTVHAASLMFSDDTLENKVENLIERMKTSGDYMIYGAYITGPLFEKLTRFFAKAGAAEAGFIGAATTKTAGISSKSVSGSKFMSNIMAGGEADFIDKVGHVMYDTFMYTAHDAVVHQESIEDALKGQLQFQGGLGMFSNFMHMAMSSHTTQAAKVNQMRTAANSKRMRELEVREEIGTDGKKRYYILDTKTNKFLFETENPNQIASILMYEVNRAFVFERAKQEILKDIVESEERPQEDVRTKRMQPTQEVSDEPDVVSGKSESAYPSTPLMDDIIYDEKNNFWTLEIYQKSKNKNFQKEAGIYLDKLLEVVKPADTTVNKPIKFDRDVMLPDGTLICRVRTFSEKPIMTENGWPTGESIQTKNEMAFWVKEPNGTEHFICASEKQNYLKAQKIWDYMCTLEEIPNDKAFEAQRQFVEEKNKGISREENKGVDRTEQKTEFKPVETKVNDKNVSETRQEQEYELPDMKGKTVVSTELDPNIERRVRIKFLDEVENIQSSYGKKIDEEIFNVDKSDTNAINKIKHKIQVLSKAHPEEAKNLGLLLDVLTGNKLCSEITRDEIAVVVQHLRRQYAPEAESIAEEIQAMAEGKFGKFSARIKSDMSLFDKIANYAKDKKNYNKPFKSAIEDVRDTDGNRFTLEIFDISPEKAKQRVKEHGIKKTAEINMKEAVEEKIKDFVEKLIESKVFDIERISNYRDAADLSLLEESVMYTLQELAKENGLVVIRNDKGIFQNKQQPSAYPAFQINLRTKSGKIIEIQIRFEPIHEYSEREHFVYDVMTGKDIIGRNLELEPLLNPFIDALKSGMTRKEYDDYYINYTRAQYRHRLLKALKIETKEPELQDFAPPGKKFDERLRAENLFLLHDLVEGVKDKSISPEEAIEKYNKAVGATEAKPTAPKTAATEPAKTQAETAKPKTDVKPASDNDRFIQTNSNIETKNPEMSYEEAVNAIDKILQKKSNISDLFCYLNVIKEKNLNEYKFNEDGEISFYDKNTQTSYHIDFDGQGNIIKYFLCKDNNYKMYVYNKSNNPIEVSNKDYNKTQPKIRTNALRNYIITNPDLLPEKTRTLLLQDENHFYTKEDIDLLAKMLDSTENIAIANKLLDTRGNESKYIRAIGNVLNLSQQKFGVRDVIKVLKSKKARAVVLNKINTNSYVKKTELEPLLEGEKFETFAEHNFSDEVDLSYRTKDIFIDNVHDICKDYITNVSVREQINSQVPDGEAACINGKMYCRAGNELVPINLTKAMFEKLFPTEERYNISQGEVGDCYFIAELGGFAATPNGRASLYSMFKQDGNDIYIRFPLKKNIEIKFKDGNLNKLYPISLYKHKNKWKFGTNDAHVNACDGIKMIEQAYAFVRNNYEDSEIQIVANDKFLMNKQMQELNSSRLGGGAGEVASLFENCDNITHYSSFGITLNGAKTIEEGLEIFAKEYEKNPNVYGSVNFTKDIIIDNGIGLFSGHQYRICGYNTKNKLIKLVNPHDSSKYIDVPLEIFKEAEPNFSVFKIDVPKWFNIKN